MFATLADVLMPPAPAETTAKTTAPDPPPRRSGPLLMGDILAARGGEPEFLRLWRRDQKADRDA